MEQGNLWSQISSSTHTVEEFVPEENRDIASFNANNEFNLATDEENIDFNIPGVPNSMVKRSHGVNVHNLIQKIENHPQRQALQSDLQQHRAIQPFQQRITRRDQSEAGNTELLRRRTPCGAKSTMQRMSDVLGTLASSTARAVTSCEMTRQRTRSTSSQFLISFLSELVHQERSTTRSPIRKERR